MTDLSWQQLSGAFARRYVAARGMAWVSGPHYMHLADIAEWVNLQKGDSKVIAAKLLDNWFETKWAMKVDFKPKFLAENLGSVFNPVVVPVEEEPNEELINARRLRDRRQQKQQELERKFAHAEQGAVPPPGSLEDMMAGIGRKLK
jgi:hypothetical protein